LIDRRGQLKIQIFPGKVRNPAKVRNPGKVRNPAKVRNQEKNITALALL
jgi:hypothetical protein